MAQQVMGQGLTYSFVMLLYNLPAQWHELYHFFKYKINT